MKSAGLLTAFIAAAMFLPAAQAAEASPGKPSRTPDVPYVPTTDDVVGHMLRMADIGSGDVVYDLGSGDGRIVIAAAKKYGARGVGIEIDPRLVAKARENARKAGVENKVSFRVADLFTVDLSEATVVTLYLFPEVNRRLKPKLFKELRPGARVISHDFDMGKDWPPEQTLDFGVDAVYMWTMPAMADRPPG